jgi:hypothetical protein
LPIVAARLSNRLPMACCDSNEFMSISSGAVRDDDDS